MIRPAHETAGSSSKGDDLADRKRELAELEMDLGMDLIRDYPKSAVTVAFVAGLAFGGIPLARRALWAAGAWGLRRALRELSDPKHSAGKRSHR